MAFLTTLLIGFSIISAVTLYAAYVLFVKNVNKSWFALASCAGLLLCLSGMQYWHLQFILQGTDVLESANYRFWLYMAPTMFFFFSRATVLPEAGVHPLMLLRLIPPLFLFFFVKYQIAVPLIFVIGIVYSFWLAHLIYGLRAQRKRFKFEMFFFGLFAILAVFILILGVSVPYIDHGYFYYSYANSIGLAFVLIVAALISFPELLSDLNEVAKISYAASTLKDVDIDASQQKLEQLMKQAKLYQNENLNLAMVAEAMDLSVHQLSELVNVQFGMNFSRYIRERRVEAAKKLLAKEPDSSVLAIGMETGFKTQSNFYAAFKEITGMSPGAYRKSLGQDV